MRLQGCMRLHEILAFSDLSASSSNVSNSFRTPFPEKVTFSREKVTFRNEKVTFTSENCKETRKKVTDSDSY